VLLWCGGGSPPVPRLVEGERSLSALPRFGRTIGLIIAIAVGYAAVGKLCILLSNLSDVVALVYPPEGLALAAGLWFGYRVWPGVLLGEFFLTLATPLPVIVCLAMAAGNTLDLLLGVYLLRRYVRLAPRFERLRDLVGLTLVVAFVCAPVSATFGVTALWWAGRIPPDQYAATWFAWWLANVLGQLLFTPALLTWAANPSLPRHLQGWVRAVPAAVTLLFVTQLPSDGGPARVCITPRWYSPSSPC
jgi:integral membrane sensor domain MASE1